MEDVECGVWCGMYGVWCGLHVWYVWGVVWTTRGDYTWRMWNVVCGVVCMGCGVDYTSGMYGVWCGLHVV